MARHPELPVIASCGEYIENFLCFILLTDKNLTWCPVPLDVQLPFFGAKISPLIIFFFLGLDSYLRLWDIKTRQLLSAVFSWA